MAKAIQFAYGERIVGTKLKYLQEAHRTNPRRRRADFVCDCGNAITTDLHWVRFHNITSCGCARKEVTTVNNTTHGQATRGKQSGAYRSWTAMHQRIKSDPHYTNISICIDWYSFENFYDDMGDRPEGMTIERVDNLGNYEPRNCKWATRLEQANNTCVTNKTGEYTNG